MSHAEAAMWSAYIKRRGSLDRGWRLENNLAEMMALMVNRSGGIKGRAVKAAEFLPRREDEQPISLADAMRTWK